MCNPKISRREILWNCWKSILYGSRSSQAELWTRNRYMECRSNSLHLTVWCSPVLGWYKLLYSYNALYVWLLFICALASINIHVCSILCANTCMLRLFALLLLVCETYYFSLAWFKSASDPFFGFKHIMSFVLLSLVLFIISFAQKKSSYFLSLMLILCRIWARSCTGYSSRAYRFQKGTLAKYFWKC